MLKNRRLKRVSRQPLALMMFFSACVTPGFVSAAEAEKLSEPTVTPIPTLQVQCEGSGCLPGTGGYSGTGTAVLRYWNQSTVPADISLDVRNVRGHSMRLLVSNVSENLQVAPKGLSGKARTPEIPVYREEIAENAVEELPSIRTGKRIPRHRTWRIPRFDPDNKAGPDIIATTLRTSIESGGFQYSLWVADSAWTEAMQKLWPEISNGSLNTRGTGIIQQGSRALGLQPWGPHKRGGVISEKTRDIHIVYAPVHGTVGIQFFNKDDIQTGTPGNQALVLYADSKIFSCQGIPEGMCVQKGDLQTRYTIQNTALHEWTHLVQAYQRGVRDQRLTRFETWLHEATAVTNGQVNASARFPQHAADQFEFVPWFQGTYVCPLRDGEDALAPGTDAAVCGQSYYKSGQAFIKYLVHQYGMSYLKTLLTTPGTGIDAIHRALYTHTGHGFEAAFLRWGGSLVLTKQAALPARYGYPAFSLDGKKVPELSAETIHPMVRFPQHLPEKLAAYSHIPLDYGTQKRAHFQQAITLAPGTAVSVYVE